ncbi:MAG: hypothetical protein ABSB29_07180 [Nitrososphaerales archaeon]
MRSQTEFRLRARKAWAVGVPLLAVALVSAFLSGPIILTLIPPGLDASYASRILTWSFQSSVDLGMGFATLALLLVFLPSVAQVLKPLDWRAPARRTIKGIGLIGAVSGLAVFAAFAFADAISIGGPNLRLMGPLILRNFYLAHAIDLNHAPGPFNIHVIGVNATVALSVAISFILVYRLEQGLFTALSKAFTLFAAPAVMVFEIGLLFFGPFTMPLQAANFLVGSPLASILTNWFLLVVSSGLFAIGLAHKKLGF